MTQPTKSKTVTIYLRPGMAENLRAALDAALEGRERVALNRYALQAAQRISEARHLRNDYTPVLKVEP